MTNKINIDIGHYENIISLAESSINGVADNIQEKTLKQYTDVVRRLFKNNQTPISAANSKGSYYAYRAAWIGYFSNSIRDQLNIIENHKINDINRWKKEVLSLKDILTYFLLIEADPNRKNLKLALEYQSAVERGIKPKFEYDNEWRLKVREEKINQQKRALKERVRNFPAGWRNKHFEAVLGKGSKHILAIAVMNCCGCRPQELFNGVSCKWDYENKAIEFEILSAKRKNESVEFRKFTIKDDKSNAFRYLQSQLFYQGQTIKLQGVNFRAVSEEVTRISKKYFSLKKQITAYCFRQAFSGDLHEAGLGAEGIAQALGHASDRTQAYYSHSKKHSSGGFSIENIESTEAVKQYRDQRINKLLNTQSQGMAMN